jgi:hypothetical protein
VLEGGGRLVGPCRRDFLAPRFPGSISFAGNVQRRSRVLNHNEMKCGWTDATEQVMGLANVVEDDEDVLSTNRVRV